MRKTTLVLLFSALLSSTAIAGMSDSDKYKAWECSGMYMANYFVPSGETLEDSMKEKSMAAVKVLKAYALETGIAAKEQEDGVNKAVDKYYGSKYDEAKTEACHSLVTATVPNGEASVKKVVQNIYYYETSINICFFIT